LLKNAPSYIEEIFSSEKITNQNIFDSKKTNDLLTKLKSGKASSETDNMALTAILSTGLLFEQFQNRKAFSDESTLDNCRIINDF
jgi:asparagine synthase (glutamine-hydrolysing)